MFLFSYLSTLLLFIFNLKPHNFKFKFLFDLPTILLYSIHPVNYTRKVSFQDNTMLINPSKPILYLIKEQLSQFTFINTTTSLSFSS